MFTVFYRVVLLASIGLVLGGTGAVYSTKYDARAAAKRLSELRHDIAQEEEKISVLRAEWSPSVAKNPYMQFVVKDAKAGDKVSVTWVDNKGDTRTDTATVS